MLFFQGTQTLLGPLDLSQCGGKYSLTLTKFIREALSDTQSAGFQTRREGSLTRLGSENSTRLWLLLTL